MKMCAFAILALKVTPLRAIVSFATQLKVRKFPPHHYLEIGRAHV